jgi:tRNA (mo5U34)-methyltransferase
MDQDARHQDARRQDALRRIRAIRWYHSIPIGDVVTPGVLDGAKSRWTAAALPADLTGRSVLDVGAWDGYFSFEAERRGAARVLAIDSLQGWHARVGTAGFECARDLLGARAEFRVLDVMDVDRLDETFDVIFFLGVYYHLTDPARALRLLFQRLRPGGELVIEGAVIAGADPVLLVVPPVSQDTDYHANCYPTVPWLQLTLRAAGFERADVLTGTWIPESSMRHSEGERPQVASRVVAALANRAAWLLGLRRLPWSAGRPKTFRVLLRARRPALPSPARELIGASSGVGR